MAKHSHAGFHLSILSSAYNAMVCERVLFSASFAIGNKKVAVRQAYTGPCCASVKLSCLRPTIYSKPVNFLDLDICKDSELVPRGDEGGYQAMLRLLL